MVEELRIQKLSFEELRGLAKRVGPATKACHLNLASLSIGSGDRAKRLPVLPGLMLASVLLTHLQDCVLSVELPASDSLRPQLTRAGLIYALAQHPHLRLDSDSSYREILSDWRQDWQVSDSTFRRRLLQSSRMGVDVAGGPEMTVQKNLLSFVNPHRSAATDLEYAVAEQNVRPWLVRRLSGRGGKLGDSQERLVHDVARTVVELLENVRHHAELSSNDHSLVQIDQTRGSASSALHLTVFDTGLGIPTTVEKRLPSHISDAGPFDSEDALRMAIEGISPYGRDRGRGIPRVRELVEHQRGQLEVVSHPGSDADQDGNGGVLASWRSDSPLCSTERMAGLPLKGTIVRATFALPASASEASGDVADRQMLLPSV